MHSDLICQLPIIQSATVSSFVLEGNLASFSIEFDGPQHFQDPDNIRRDLLKKSICERFQFPILQLDSQFLRPVSSTARVVKLACSLWLDIRLYQSESADRRSGNYVGFCWMSDTNQQFIERLIYGKLWYHL